MTRNTDLLQRVLDHITAHPRGHDQGFYGKRTGKTVTMCVAGRASVLAGATPEWERNPFNEELFFAVTFDGKRVTVFEFAREQLGLSGREAGRLFFTHNERARDLLRVLIAGEEMV